MDGFEKPLVRLRRRVEAGEELSIGLRRHGDQCPVEKRVLRGPTRRIDDEIGAVLSKRAGSLVNELSDFRLDTDVESASVGYFVLHGDKIAGRNDIVTTFNRQPFTMTYRRWSMPFRNWSKMFSTPFWYSSRVLRPVSNMSPNMSS
jgi:hypothetical protein